MIEGQCRAAVQALEGRFDMVVFQHVMPGRLAAALRHGEQQTIKDLRIEFLRLIPDAGEGGPGAVGL
ncbi:hypothetical protein [Bradyrhizobium sp. Leo170]|uniref:hypothetical protein n=1 Tax=Bradyrhizobium sp. Leo170 TaxID=1571199 RepID=UPI001A916F76|nr:hypothetical protein [Bradyrhizobium sp. Leo170]